MKNKLLICPYCSAPAKLVTGEIIYPHRADLAPLMLWACKDCDAYVGCHKTTTTPLGRLANASLRRAKSNAHCAFDPLWKSGKMNRRAAYQWLADELGIPFKKTHIGEFDEAMCERVMESCQTFQMGSFALGLLARQVSLGNAIETILASHMSEMYE